MYSDGFTALTDSHWTRHQKFVYAQGAEFEYPTSKKTGIELTGMKKIRIFAVSNNKNHEKIGYCTCIVCNAVILG